MGAETAGTNGRDGIGGLPRAAIYEVNKDGLKNVPTLHVW